VEVNGPRQWSLPLNDASQVAEARRRAATLAEQLRFDETRGGALSIAVTEAATNIVKHAQAGELVLRALNGGPPGVELLALDRGPGIADLGQCLRDGYSTRGTSGTGLGSIQRQADEFDAHSLPGKGTALLARFWASKPGRPAAGPRAALRVGAVCLPIRGEEAPGDDWDLQTLPAGSRLMVADGLGHGTLAAEAAAAAVATLRENPGLPLPRLLEKMHNMLRATRGAVAAIAELDADNGVVLYAGIGNISAVLWGPERSQNLVSMNGTMGHSVTSVREFSYAWPKDGLLVVHSDGLSTRWDLELYPGLTSRDPSLVAGVLYRDFARGKDDVTVLVARRTEPSA
jgi:anti-sigma regulatory factor (Ser/Thr protein kinase)